MSGADLDQDRWSSPQGNVTGLGIVAGYSPRFWTLVIGLGVITGVGAGLLMELLHLVQHLSFGGHGTALLPDVESAPGWRRVLVLVLAAVVVTAGLRILGRRATGATEVTEAIWFSSGKVAFWHGIGRAVLSIVAVGMGVSLGKEGAPQLVGAAFASRACEWADVPVWQRRLLVAAGAGAGFGAVYNVPLGGALFAVEVMLGSLALPLVLPALAMSLTATATAWLFLGTGTTYHVSTDRFRISQLVFALLMGPIIGVLGTGWTRLIRAANQRRPKGRVRWVMPLLVFTGLGLLSLRYPQLLGNGHGVVQLGISGKLGLGLLVMLFLLKPLATAACTTTGAPGGLFTPTFAVGVLLAGVAGALWAHVWPGAIPGSYALIGGGAFLAATMQAPLSGVVLVLELTRHIDTLMVPTLLAVVEATVISRKLGARSIYSARSHGVGAAGASPSANAAAAASIHALDEALPPAPEQFPVSGD